MAVSARYLKCRYRESSDGLVTGCDAKVPGSVVVRPDQKLDHVWMVYSTARKDDVEADFSEMCEALLTMLVEIGKVKEEAELKSRWRSRLAYKPMGNFSVRNLEHRSKMQSR